MWLFNKPYVWLKSLPPSEFTQVMEDARHQAPKIKAQFRERERKIAELRAARQREKREQLRAKEEEKVRECAQLIDRVEGLGGLWKTEEQVSEGLARVKQSGRGEGKGRLLRALKNQKGSTSTSPRPESLDFFRKLKASQRRISYNKTLQSSQSGNVDLPCIQSALEFFIPPLL